MFAWLCAKIIITCFKPVDLFASVGVCGGVHSSFKVPPIEIVAMFILPIVCIHLYLLYLHLLVPTSVRICFCMFNLSENTHFLRKAKYHCMTDLQFDQLGFGQTSKSVYSFNSTKHLNPNQSNRRSAVQWYFPLQSKWVFSELICTDTFSLVLCFQLICVSHVQCDKIELFLKVIGYKFSNKSCQNIWQFSRLLWKALPCK